MSSPPWESVIAHLREGDVAAAEQAYAACEPYLFAVVRRRLPQQLRRRIDSTDIVQSIWADLLEGFRSRRWYFEDERMLRGFLVRVARNRIIDRYRQHVASIGREQSITDPSYEAADQATAAPSQIAQSDDLWQRMLALCPPEHHEILRLKREGYTLLDIAARTGLHEGSVRRILRNLARDLARQQGSCVSASDA
jgi:RNA polymerase sigma factor (sigma-70 family)